MNLKTQNVSQERPTGIPDAASRKTGNRIGILLILGWLIFIGSCKKEPDESAYTGDLFKENIRSTEPRTAEEERLGFKLPPGFEIQLFASEPEIDKPINLAFDARGRMWVTQSFEYPFPASPGTKGKDRLTILEDTDHDGKADRFTHVDDSLNIPIGILPLVDGAIAFSIPNVYRFADSDGDGKPESKKVLVGPFGYVDTHGMVSNFTRGYDGWVYACHGFTNSSVVAGTDGDSMRMVSGNTFRFKLDGSRVEHMTFGQVNPFGLAYDENGYIYSTDSHSSPIYQLIRGGDYPHFSKLEIMAFGPDMKSFEDEGTALCGIAYYGDTKFPKEFQGNFFIGGPLTSRVHRYSWAFNGSSPRGKSETDFVKSADPWFRPVNIKLGPDGALYVADFYNAIIGHYEVPLGHPKRDKQRGRIWRITYKGQHNDLSDLTTASVDDLMNAIDTDNLTIRMAAADQLADRVGQPAVLPLQKLLTNEGTSPRKYIHALWVLYRLNGMSKEILERSSGHTSPPVRLHTLRILREWKSDTAFVKPILLTFLKDTDPHIQRAAVELLPDYDEIGSVEALLSVLHSTPVTDTHLIYTSRLCLRDLLRDNQVMKQVGAKVWSQEDAGRIAGVLVDVASPDAAIFLANHVDQYLMPKEKIQLAYQQVMRFLPEGQVDNVLKRERDQKDLDIEWRSLIFKGVREGLAQRGGGRAQLLAPWGVEIAEGLLEKYPATDTSRSEEKTRQQNFALQLAGDYKVLSLGPALKLFVEKKSNANIDLKISALTSILKLDAGDSAILLAEKILMNDTIGVELRKRVAGVLGEFPGPAVNKVLAEVKNARPDLEAAVVAALATTTEGKEIIFNQVKNGSFQARTLTDPRVQERMLLGISPNQQKKYNDLIANVEPISQERQSLIDERLKAFKAFQPTPVQADSGQMVFGPNCGTCHRKLTDSGIGPQLHGIGKRGADALAEKILDPNRNISEAFRNYTIRLKDGRVLTGLYRRDQGAVIVFGDLTGKEFSVPRKDIAEQQASRYTIMPDHFGTTLSQKEFNLLMAYLLTW